MASYALWGGSAGGARGFDATVYGGTYGRQSPAYGANDDKAANTESVRKLLSELMDAEKTSKSQTAQDLRNKLNDKREELGDEKFKEIMKELMEKADVSWLEHMRRLMKLWFPELDDASPTPSPPSPGPSPGGGGGGSRANPSDFGPRDSMSNLPLTEGSKHYNYKVDNSNPGQKPKNIWSGFSQGPTGNCVTVSAIKAAMQQFGQKPTDVFKSVKESGNGWDVVMRDGVSVHVSKDELKMAAEYARFKGDDPSMITDANFMYAASVKRAQKEGNDGYRNLGFYDAMRTLNDGEHSREGLYRLGLKNNMRAATDADLRRSRVGTVEYGGHSMAVLDGRIELWGSRGGAPRSGTATVLFGS